MINFRNSKSFDRSKLFDIYNFVKIIVFVQIIYNNINRKNEGQLHKQIIWRRISNLFSVFAYNRPKIGQLPANPSPVKQ